MSRMATIKGAQDGFFHWNHPEYMVEVLTNPEDYADQVAISIHGDGSISEKRLWTKALPAMSHLREIHFGYRPIMAGVAELHSVEHLNYSIAKIQTLEPLKHLRCIRSFNLERATSLRDPHVIGEWTELECLALQNIKALHEIEWIAKLPKIRHLRINGSMWTTQKLQSLKPLASLPTLEWVELRNCKVEDKESIFVLAELPNLKTFISAEYWPRGHLTRLSEMRPDMTINEARYPNIEEVRKR